MMRSFHVSQKLSPYCHGELSEEESRRVAEHLIGCKRCRQEFEEIKLGVKLAEQLPRTSAPASMWSEIEAALSNSTQPTAEMRVRRAFAFNWQAIVAACTVLLLAIGAVWFFTHRADNSSQITESKKQESNTSVSEGVNSSGNQPKPEIATATPPVNSNKVEEIKTVTPKPAWDVARLEGAPKVGAERIEGNGRLAVGEWLETDATSRAQINVANIGRVEIEPNSRVRLVETNATEHRLAMTRGGLHATISAPPRL